MFCNVQLLKKHRFINTLILLRINAEFDALMVLMDKLNRQGRGTLYFAGQGIQPAWQMKREMLSPRYTTRSSDLPVVKAN